MIAIGNHIKTNVRRGLADQVRQFYREILGCKSLPSPAPNLDLYEFANSFVLGVFFCDDADVLTDEQCLNAAWLEIKTASPQEIKGRLLRIGVKKVDYPDKSRFYFQAPGGQVFRLAPEDGGI